MNDKSSGVIKESDNDGVVSHGVKSSQAEV